MDQARLQPQCPKKNWGALKAALLPGMSLNPFRFRKKVANMLSLALIPACYSLATTYTAAQTELDFGHDRDILFKRYCALVCPKAFGEYFTITQKQQNERESQ
mgnify:CR=1 FL=1